METNRTVVPELEAILDQPIKVLDDGFVRCVDYLGSDESIVQAARTSYGKGTKRVSEDRGLIRYLMRHGHTTPFEMCELKLHIRVPMDAWRQWVRHRMANINEYSTRYSEAIDSAQTTEEDQWRLQATDNKQGSAGIVEKWPANDSVALYKNLETLGVTPGQHLTKRELELQQFCRQVYDERLEFGVAREQARKDLPLSTYTEAYWKVDLHNLFHFLRLRMDGHAQKEIRDYATVIGHQIVSKWVPSAWEAFMDYRVESMQLTRLDKELIRIINERGDAITKAKEFGWLDVSEKTGNYKRNRERTEFELKAASLGVKVPWSIEHD